MTRYNYAVVLETNEDSNEALALLEVALEAEPEFERARTLRDDLIRPRALTGVE